MCDEREMDLDYETGDGESAFFECAMGVPDFELSDERKHETRLVSADE